VNSKVAKQFSREFYAELAFDTLHWQGVRIVKCPFDLHMYQEILFETKPTLIIETGAFVGGSALYLSHLCDIRGEGRVISIELESDRDLPKHPRLTFLAGVSSTDLAVLDHLREEAKGERVMVILDSDHSKQHVLREMQLYHRLVSKGCYLIVEDTNPDGYQFAPNNLEDGGPMEAIKAFQPTNNGFKVDEHRERLGLSFNQGGYLRRIR
jgi:cephalosporin hydroxylase